MKNELLPKIKDQLYYSAQRSTINARYGTICVSAFGRTTSRRWLRASVSCSRRDGLRSSGRPLRYGSWGEGYGGISISRYYSSKYEYLTLCTFHTLSSRSYPWERVWNKDTISRISNYSVLPDFGGVYCRFLFNRCVGARWILQAIQERACLDASDDCFGLIYDIQVGVWSLIFIDDLYFYS